MNDNLNVSEPKLLNEADYFKPTQEKVLQTCGTSPDNQYHTTYHINYFSTALLIGVIVIAIILLEQNWNAIKTFFIKYYIQTIFTVLLVALLGLLCANIAFRPYQLRKFRNDFQHQFYSRQFVYTSEYQNYLNCESGVK
jgi:hypothetical protein